MNSSMHASAILSSHSNQVGIACAYENKDGKDHYYCTGMFLTCTEKTIEVLKKTYGDPETYTGKW